MIRLSCRSPTPVLAGQQLRAFGVYSGVDRKELSGWESFKQSEPLFGGLWGQSCAVPSFLDALFVLAPNCANIPNI
jgi:hypothetical protein